MAIIPVSGARRIVDIKEALTLKREGSGGNAAYGVGVPDADHTLLVPSEGLNLAVPKAEKYTDEDLIGTGSEYATQQAIIKWALDGFSRDYLMNPLTDLIWLYFCLGGLGTTTPEAGVFLHTLKQLDFAGASPQLPSFSSIQRAQTGWFYKIFGQVVEQVEVTITRTQIAKMKVTFRGSGKIDTVSTFTFPAPTSLRFYRGANVEFEMGLHDGTRDDYKQVLHEMTLTFSNEFSDEIAYFPGSGGQGGAGSEGQVKGAELIGKRSFSVKLNLYQTNSVIFDWLRQEKLVQVFARMNAGVIGATTENYFTSFLMPSLHVDSLEPTNLDKFQGWSATLKPIISGSLGVPDLLQAQVQNDIDGATVGAIPA